MLTILIKLFVLLPISLLIADRSDFKLPTGKRIIAKTLVHAVENMGYEPASGFHVSYSSTSEGSAQRQASIINEFLFETSQDVLVSVDDIRKFNSTSAKARIFTLLLIDSVEAFRRMEPILRGRIYDTSGKHIILISEQLDEVRTMDLIQMVFDEFFRNYIVNVELVVRNATTGFMDFYTYFPVSPSYCFKVIPVLHGTFKEGKPTTALNLFPHKFDNFYGCPLSVVTFPFPPHVFLKHVKGKVKGDGIDIKVLYGVSAKLNFSVVLIDSKERGVQYPNGSLTGAIRMLYDHQANITVGGYGSAAKAMQLFSPSVAYLHTAMVFAIPPPREYSPLERLLLPFDFDVWVAIGLTFGLTFLASIVLSAWNKSYRDLIFGSTVRYPLFEMVVVYLGGAVARFPSGAIPRNVILQWLIVSTVLSSCYKAILFGMLKTGFLKKFPSTVEGMLNEGYVVDVPLPLMQNLKDGPLGGRDSFFLLKYSIHTHYAILQTGKSNRMVIDTNIQLQHFNSIYYEAGILNSLPQRLFIFPMYFYYRKESFLVDPFDEILKRFIQSGLITFWQDSVLNVSHLGKTETSNTMNPLVVNNFQGCFALCGVLIACSVAVFILEVLSKRMNLLKRILICSSHSMNNK